MRDRGILFSRVLAILLFGAIASADTISTWLGGPGPWSTASQWSPPVVPNNTPTTQYDVVINPGGIVPVDISPTINSLSAGVGGTGGLLYAVQGMNPQLTVVNNATVDLSYVFFAAVPIYPMTPGAGPGSLSVGGDLNVGSSSDQFIVDGSVTVGGNMTTASKAMVFESSSGANQLTVGGTLTNQVGGTLFLGNSRCFGAFASCPGANQPTYGPPVGGPNTTVGALVNNGTLYSWSTVTTSTLVNNGTASFIGDTATVDTLKNAGTLYISNSCCSIAPEQTAGINVGSGASGSGYHQSANGVLDEVLSGSTTYGQILLPPWQIPPNGAFQGYPVDLDGTLDIMLQNGFVPTIGESFIIISTLSGDLSGTFSNVTWDSFDYGRGYFLVSYHSGDVIVTAEANVPEPGTIFMLIPPLAVLLFWIYRRRAIT
jgi:hypothetical protein